jgi:integrase
MRAAKGASELPATENHNVTFSFRGGGTPTCSVRPRHLSPDECAALVAAIENDPHKSDLKDVVTIVLNTGLRSNELCNLHWNDINFTDCQMSVRSKSGHIRKVPFGPEVFQLLCARKDREAQSEYVLGDSPRVLLNRVSRQLVVFSAFCFKFIVTLHTLRNTFMSCWVNAGGNPEVLFLIAGYRSRPSVYKHFLSQESQRKAAVQFQNRLENS